MPEKIIRVPSLYNGMSQQPTHVRFENQVHDAQNALFSVVDGVSKRPGSMYLATVSGLEDGTDYRMHAIERDDEEKYVVIFGHGTVKVYQPDGTASTVNIDAEAQGYLTLNNPNSDQIRLISIADYTFILNTAVTVVTDNDAGIIDPSTMPIQMVRTTAPAAGTPAVFTISLATWDVRASGDADTNPIPNLLDGTHQISDISFAENRLWLFGDEYALASQAGDLFDFWLDDSSNIVDSDPVEVQLSEEEVTIIDFAMPFRNTIIIFTKAGRQFELDISRAITPTNAPINASTAYDTESVRPHIMGDMLYFMGRKRGSSMLYEYFYDDSRISNVAANVSAHVPHFLGSGTRSMAVSTNDNTVFVLSTKATGGTIGTGEESDPSFLLLENGDNILLESGDKIILEEFAAGGYQLGVYRSFWRNERKEQSAWSYYEFDSTYEIHDIAVIGNTLYMLVEIAGSFVIEALHVTHELSPGSPVGDQFLLPDGSRPSPATPSDYPFVVYLDRMARLTGSLNGSDTEWTFPVSDETVDTIVLADGTVLTPTSVSGQTVTFVGTDYTGQEAIIGRGFTMSAKLTRPYRRDNDKIADIDAKLFIKRIAAFYHNSAGLRIRTVLPNRSDRTKSMDLSAVDAVGDLHAWLNGEAGHMDVYLENTTPKPSTVTAVEYTCDYEPRESER